jgi:hypothetical protein
MVLDEDEKAFLERRAAEERQKMKETSCIVKAVHEEMVELYEERNQAAEAETAALETLLKRLD